MPQGYDGVCHGTADDKAASLYHAGLCYSRGDGVVKDSAMAARCFEQAAEMGHAPSRYRLGLMYRDGIGVEEDARRAAYWLYQAVCAAVDPSVVPKPRQGSYRLISMRQMQQERIVPLLRRRESVRREERGGRWLSEGAAVPAAHGTIKIRSYNRTWTWRRLGGYPEDALLKTAATAAAVSDGTGQDACEEAWDVSIAAMAMGRLLETGARYALPAVGNRTHRRDVTPDPLKALAFYRLAAARGHSEGWRRMADLYRTGCGVPPDLGQAMRLYRRAAELGNERAMFALGVCYEDGVGVSILLAEQGEGAVGGKTAAGRAAEWYRKAAEAGYAPAQNNLGGCYEAGLGVRQNPAMAIHWYTLAAEQSQPEACCRLGRCYETGWGIERDPDRALELYNRAREWGHPYAYYRLGICYERGVGVPVQRGQAADWYRRGAEGGVPESQYAYALCLRAGRGVRRDEQAAYEWFRRAAEQGHVAAAWEIGEYLRAGRLVLQNQKQAARWLCRAVDGYERVAEMRGPEADTLPELAVSAEEAAGNALYRLSCCVRYGEGITVKEPEKEALELTRRATRLGNADAMTSLADWYAQESLKQDGEANGLCAESWYRRAMEQGQPDAGYRLACWLMERSERMANATANAAAVSEAAELLKAEAERGHVEALCALASCYFEGRGVPKDPAVGFDLLLKAADAPVSMVRAQVLVGDCYRMGWGTSPDPEKAVEYTLRAVQSLPRKDRYPWMGPRCPRWYAHKVHKEDALARTEARFRLSVYGTGAQERGDSAVCERFLYLCEAVMEGHAAAREHLACIVAGRSTPDRYFPWLKLTTKPMDLTLYRGVLEELSPVPAETTWTATGEVTADMCAAALNYVGDGFYEGRCGLPRKPETAVQCYREAAAVSGQVWAQYSLGFCLLYGVGTAANADEAVVWLTRAADGGHAGACRLLGMCHETGEGVDSPNRRVALKYYRKALKLGDADAAPKVKELEKKLKKRRGA